MVKLVNRAMMTTQTTGTGNVTLLAAVDGYHDFDTAGVGDGDTVPYTIEDGEDFEIGLGTYNSVTKVLTRVVAESSNNNAKINLSGDARVFVTVRAEDIIDLQTQIDGKSASGHGHAISDTSGLQAALDGKATSAQGAKADSAVQPVSGHGLYPDADKAKLAGIASQATKNATDAQLRDRSTHTGAQPISTVTGLQTALNDKLDADAAAVSADKLTTPRSIALSGDVSGSTSFDGSGNVTISATVANNSHTHTIANIGGLQSALDGKATSAQGAKADAAIPSAEKGALNGVATLDGTGKVPAAQLPSYVDDVEEYASFAAFPGTGEDGKIYVDEAQGDIYRWSGSAYVQINDAVSSADQATKLATARTISLGGDLTGSTSFDGSGNVTINAAVKDDSHSHTIANVDGLQTALDGKLATGAKAADANLWDGWDRASYLNQGVKTSDSPTFVKAILTSNGASDNLRLGDDAFIGDMNRANTFRVRGSQDPSAGYIVFGDGDGTALGRTGLGRLTYGDQAVFTDDYHPNADKLTTARTISLSGDVSGSASFDGSGNVTINATVADDSHNHTIANVDGLQSALDGKLASSAKAADSDKLDGLDSSSYARTDQYETFEYGLRSNGDIVSSFGTLFDTHGAGKIPVLKNHIYDPRYDGGSFNLSEFRPNLIYDALKTGYTYAVNDETGISGASQLFKPDTTDHYTTLNMAQTANVVEIDLLGSLPTTTNVNSIRIYAVWHGGGAYNDHEFAVKRSDGVWVTVPVDPNLSAGALLVSEPLTNYASYPANTPWTGIRYRMSNKAKTSGYSYLYGIGLYGARAYAYPYSVHKGGDTLTGTLTSEMLQPRMNDAYDLGSNSLRYQNLYLSGNVNVDGSVDGRDISADGSKLDGIATNATKNATDAQLRDRGTHTGVQAISTVTGLQAALDGKLASGANAVSASKLSTARTISLTGDASGAVSFDGSSNVSINVTVADDSHNHTIANVDGLQTALNGKLATGAKAADSDKLDGLDSSQFLRSDQGDTVSGRLNFTQEIDFGFPVNHLYATDGTDGKGLSVYRITNTFLGAMPPYNYNCVLHFGVDDQRWAEIAVPYGSNTGLFFRGRQDNGTTTPWRTIWHDANDGAGSGLDADKLDGLHASAFATSAQGGKADTAYGWGNHASAGYLTAVPFASQAEVDAGTVGNKAVAPDTLKQRLNNVGGSSYARTLAFGG